jgi:hypothetical protein
MGPQRAPDALGLGGRRASAREIYETLSHEPGHNLGLCARRGPDMFNAAPVRECMRATVVGLSTASACRRSHISSEPVASRASSRPGRSLHSSRRSSLNQHSLVVHCGHVVRRDRDARWHAEAAVCATPVGACGREDPIAVEGRTVAVDLDAAHL